MSVKYYTIQIRGKEHYWSIPVGSVSKQAVKDWIADGLDITEVHNSIPQWVATLGYIPIRIYCALQDIYCFQNPFTKQPTDKEQ